MAEIPFLAKLNMMQNEIIQALFENLPSPPPNPKIGQVYFDTTLKYGRQWDGTTWKAMFYTHPNHTGDVTSDGDGATTIVANKVTNAKLAKMGANTIKGNNTTGTRDPLDLTVSQVIVMLADLDATLGGANPSDQKLSSQKAIKTYIDLLINNINTAVSGALVYQGGYNASTNTPNLDTPPTIAGIKKGFTWIVTAEGNFFTEFCEIGDMVISLKDNPTTLADWTVVNRNIPAIVDASETVKGIIQLATQVEVDAGLNDTKAVTPKKLKNYVENQITTAINTANAKMGQSIAVGATTSTITHNWGTTDVAVLLTRTLDGQRVHAEVVCKANAVTVNFGYALTETIAFTVAKL